MAEPTVTITILSWNNWKMLDRCIASIIKNPPRADYEIIVVDNGSTDDIVGQLRVRYPDVSVIINACNRGIGPARNQAFKKARGNYIISLDQDTVVGTNSLDNLINYMEKHPMVGIGGAKLLYPSGELQYSCRRFPTLFSKISRRIKNPLGDRILAVEYYAEWDHNEVRDVDYVIGACQVIRRDAMEKIGFYDEHIFYGPEDIDYCWRFGRAGYRVAYIPSAVIIHDEQRITKKKFFSKLTLLHAYGLVYFFLKMLIYRK